VFLTSALLFLPGCDALNTATDENKAPTAEASVSSSPPFNVNDPVQLSGGNSSDPDGDELSYFRI
jgi:hypothetical protein